MVYDQFETDLKSLIRLKKQHIRDLARGIDPDTAFEKYQDRIKDLKLCQQMIDEIFSRVVQTGMHIGESADSAITFCTDFQVPACKYPPRRGPIRWGDSPKKSSPKLKIFKG